MFLPELHDHGARHRAGAALSTRSPSSGWSSRRTSRSGVPASSASKSSRVSGRSSTGATEQLRGPRPSDGLDRPGCGLVEADCRDVIPLAGSVKEAGYTSEEWKLVHESRKILHNATMRVTVTCVRGPVYVGHAMTANVEFRDAMTKGRGRRAARVRAGCAARRTAATACRCRSRAPASTRCCSAAWARICRSRACSTSGSRRQPAQGCLAQRGADGRNPAHLR